MTDTNTRIAELERQVKELKEQVDFLMSIYRGNQSNIAYGERRARGEIR